MSAFWHPAMRVDWLVLQRTGPMAWIGMFGGPVLLLACCVSLACGDLFAGYGWCLAVGVLLALGGSYAIAHYRLLDALERWRFGWCGALPIARGAAARTLLLLAAAALMASLAVVSVLLCGISVAASHGGDLPYALAGIGLALIVGVVAAAVRAFRPGALARAHQADGIREPLLALRWLNDPRLPHLLDWQRRAALVRWRRGGGAVVVLVLLAVPDGASIPTVVGMVWLLGALVWLDIAVRASADVACAAVPLLGATPLDARCARKASLRYPLAAAFCVLVPIPVVALFGGRGAVALAWIVCASVAAAWPLHRIFRATRSPDTPA